MATTSAGSPKTWFLETRPQFLLIAYALLLGYRFHRECTNTHFVRRAHVYLVEFPPSGDRGKLDYPRYEKDIQSTFFYYAEEFFHSIEHGHVFPLSDQCELKHFPLTEFSEMAVGESVA